MEFTKSKPQLSWSRLGASALLALTLLGGVPAFPGTKDGGGGGNARKSTRADLEEIVNNLYRLAWESSDTYAVGAPMRLTSRDLPSLLRYVNQKVTGFSYFAMTGGIVTYVSGLKFEIHEECFEGLEAKDASTEYRKGAPICLSEKRLARFPKSALRVVILPLVLHEVTHQFGFGEGEANAIQALADIHFKYLQIYLASVRARFGCAYASDTLTAAQKREVLKDLPNKLPGTSNLSEWPSLSASEKESARVQCAINATTAGNNLDRVYDGSVWENFDPKTLSKMEKQQLLDYQRHSDAQGFTYETMVHGLVEPPFSGPTDCDVCKIQNIDSYYLMMLASKAAMEKIDFEVGRLQSAVSIY